MTVGSHPAADRAGSLDLSAARRILVVRPDNLGDVVLLTPALRALRDAAPADVRLDLLATPAGAAVVPLIDSVDDVVEVPSVSWQDADDKAFDPDAHLALIRRLAAARYDVAVLFTSYSQSPWPAAFICASAGIPVRVGASREFGGTLLTHWMDALPDGQHQTDRALALLSRFGVPTDHIDPRLVLKVPADAVAAVRRRLAALDPTSSGAGGGSDGISTSGGPYAVLLPGATCSSRRYPEHRFAAVAGGLTDAGLRVVVAGTAREAELVERVRRGTERVALSPDRAGIGLAGELSLPELVALLRDAAVVVTNNSGGAHLADAVRAPVVVLYAGTEREAEYQPRSGPRVLLRRPTTCSPCRAFVCPYQHECLDIPPAEVAAAAAGLVSGLPARTPGAGSTGPARSAAR
ncbi:heptosyltransferase [Pseudofrankia asymbiotica]|uniref:Heptosyltransferase n=1 Tax=Pseudofrankia asymbiotica TaxID=1834516 RepID=A0A1V2I2I7_9ACTN|nr:heptosyltransferase [Pseudofrankia asymbiotica]